MVANQCDPKAGWMHGDQCLTMESSYYRRRGVEQVFASTKGVSITQALEEAKGFRMCAQVHYIVRAEA